MALKSFIFWSLRSLTQDADLLKLHIPILEYTNVRLLWAIYFSKHFKKHVIYHLISTLSSFCSAFFFQFWIFAVTKNNLLSFQFEWNRIAAKTRVSTKNNFMSLSQRSQEDVSFLVNFKDSKIYFFKFFLTFHKRSFRIYLYKTLRHVKYYNFLCHEFLTQ